MNVIVNVVGLEALKKVLKEKIEKVNGNVEKAVVKATLKVEADAKKKVPIDTGRLRSSISNKIEKIRDEITGKVGTNVVYAPYIEFGTGRMRPKPYLYPALQKNFKFIKDTIPGAVLEGFKK